MIPIDMICKFSVEGIPKPMRFRYIDNEEYRTIHINRIIETTKQNNNKKLQYLFKCSSIIDDFEKFYIIKYDHETCKWFLRLG